MPEPTEKQIMQRAYELWIEPGRPDNREELLKAEAEKELRELPQQLQQSRTG